MKESNTQKKAKEIIVGEKISKEGIYYAALFGAALITSIVLLIVSTKRIYRGLTIYSSVLIPLFAIACAWAVRYIMTCKNRIYIENGELVIKSFFANRRFKISEIKKFTANHNENTGLALIKISYGENNCSYKLNITKEQTLKLKRSVYGK